MVTASPTLTHANNDTNRNLVRIFSICLSTLVLSYTVLAFRQFLEQGAFDVVTLLTTSVRLLLGVAALIVVLNPPWLASRLERQVDAMGGLFETGYGNTSTSEKIRLIVLVTMVSLLLELVMIRWLASVFPVFSFFKNFTLLACFLGLGAGYAVAEKQPCAPALVLPMLALFAGVIVLLRYDVAADQGLFGALPMWEQTSVQLAMDAFDWMTLIRLSMPLYLLLGMSFILCACICYPIGQLCGKLLHSSNALKAYGLNLAGSILGVVALFVMSLFWLPPVGLVCRGRRDPAVFCVVARRAPAARRGEFLRAADDSRLAGAAGNPADLFAVSIAGAHGQAGRPDADSVGRVLLSEGLQFGGEQARA